ncbi:MAG: alpha/beta fold hydrolase [Actinomycetota bacterium]|nr:alpha/beta fold hydrolase [Actinomycetota bacterium]
MNKRRRTVIALSAGALAAGGAAAYSLERTIVRRWQVDSATLAAAGRTLPGDLVHRSVTVSDGGRIHVVERGEGPPLILVHGVTLSAATWAPQIHALSSRHRVVAVDQRGHGQSFAGADGYSMERLADDLAEVIDTLDVTDAVVVGHSMGGMVSQLMAVRQPDLVARRVRGLVLVATSAGPIVPAIGGTAIAQVLTAGAVRGLKRAGRRGEGIFFSDDAGAWMTRASFGSRPDPADIELTRSMTSSMSPEALAELLGPLLSFDVRHRLHRLDLPTTIVVGTRDVLTPPRMARAMHSFIAGSDLVEIPGCGHMVMLERSEMLNELLVRCAAEAAK